MHRRALLPCALFASLLALQAWARKPLGDFQVFYVAAARTLHGQPIYRASDGLYPFKYAPGVAWLLSPLALFPEHLAALLWSLSTAIALTLAVGGAFRLARHTPGRFGAVAVLLLCFPFAEHLFELGQCDAFLILLAVGSEAMRHSRPRLSGAALAIACLFKPPFLLLAGLLVARREWPRLSAFALTVGVGLLSGGLAELGAWRQLLSQSTPDRLCGPQNQSVFALACFAHAGAPGSLAQLSIAAALGAAAVAGLGALCLRAAPGDRSALAFATALYLTAFLSPLGWRTNLLTLIPCLVLLLGEARRGVRLAWVALFVQLLGAVLFNYDVLGALRFERLLRDRGFAWEGLLVATLCALLVAFAPRPVGGGDSDLPTPTPA